MDAATENPPDLLTRAGLERYAAGWWKDAQERLRVGAYFGPHVMHVIDKNPHDGTPLAASGLWMQQGVDARRARQIAVQLGSRSILTAMIAADDDAEGPELVVLVAEHPTGDRAWIGVVRNHELEDPIEAPDIIKERTLRVLDAVAKNLS